MRRYTGKSKIHGATVTDANLEYEGSITLDPELMRTADLLEVVVNGAAARLVRNGAGRDSPGVSSRLPAIGRS